MKTFKVLSALLSYPTAELVAAGDELKTVLNAEAVLPKSAITEIAGLIDDLASGDLLFCAHHGTKFKEKLFPTALNWHDESARLLESVAD